VAIRQHIGAQAGGHVQGRAHAATARLVSRISGHARAGLDAYVLADRATWLAFKNPAKLAVLVEGDQRLFNQYGVLVVNPAKHPHVKVADAQKFADWIVSPAGQTVIAGYKINGQQLFFPNAGR
jgi:tungstate transport system substrate-binding protein